jgi:hypothetical protein
MSIGDGDYAALINNMLTGQPQVGTPDLGTHEYWAPGALRDVRLPLVRR